MRLVTWNIARGTAAEKEPFILPLLADVLVLQECARPDEINDRHLWFGPNVSKGVSVQTFGDYRLSPLPVRPDVPPFFIPLEVIGPESFILIAVWAQKEPYLYVEGVSRAIAAYADLIGTRATVLIGDFNSNAIWNAEHPAEHNHSAIVSRLDQLGCASAYHEYFGEAHGSETRHTYFHWWKEERPFHIDYVFIPKLWLPRLERVELGSFAQCKGASDHRPVSITLRDADACT
jgi:exonuclease III